MLERGRLKLGVGAALLLLSCAGSSAPHDAPCAPDEYRYVDQQCDLTTEGWICTEDGRRGDGLCYQRCETNDGCSSAYPCVRIGLFAGGDYYCNETVKVCAAREDADCP